MTFGPDHYVPILKIKQGEKKSLASVTSAIRRRMTPLLEVVDLGKKSLQQHIVTSFKDLAQGVSGFTRYFLDTHEISAAGAPGSAWCHGRLPSCGRAGQ